MAPLVLITGATGHLGFRTLVLLLEIGYRVRVTHRRPDQVDSIRAAASIQRYLGMIEFMCVPDITAASAYDEAITGVDGVLHIASPIHTSFEAQQNDWRRLLYDPAEKGTLCLLTAALKEPRMTRVIITSSVVVVEPKNGSDRAGPYDLRNLPDSKTLDSAPTAEMAYIYSKVVSHIAGTKFVEENPGHFDLIRVLPGYIQGAHELYTAAEQLSNDKRSGSNEGVMNTALGNVTGFPRTNAQVFLDDVAKAHVLALRPSVAKDGDNLLLVSNAGNSIPWSDFVPVIERLFPTAVREGTLKPSAVEEDRLTYFDVESSERALGFSFAGLERMVSSVVGQYLDLLESQQGKKLRWFSKWGGKKGAAKGKEKTK